MTEFLENEKLCAICPHRKTIWQRMVGKLGIGVDPGCGGVDLILREKVVSQAYIGIERPPTPEGYSFAKELRMGGRKLALFVTECITKRHCPKTPITLGADEHVGVCDETDDGKSLIRIGEGSLRDVQLLYALNPRTPDTDAGKRLETVRRVQHLDVDSHKPH